VFLAGDIGGTNARLALVSDRGAIVRSDVLESTKHPSLESAVRAFLGAKSARIAAATFGIAGPVIRQRCEATNLPWVVDAAKVSRALRIPRVTLINDLVALAYGSLLQPRARLAVLQVGPPAKRGENVCTLAAGTGLGEAALIWDGDRHVPLATEGAHADFAPQRRTEWDLFEYAARRFDHVSYERLVSGPGIGVLYDFVREVEGVRESKANEARIEESSDRNREITELGESGKSRPADVALDLFSRLYGAEAGNLALKTLATGGVFVAGRIAATLAGTLKRRGFLEAFRAKGRFRKLLERVPVAVVLDSGVGLAGAAFHVRASRSARS
jgi:glucokinase